MSQVLRCVLAVALLGLSGAVNLRLPKSGLVAVKANKTVVAANKTVATVTTKIKASAFSKDFLVSVDAELDRMLPDYSSAPSKPKATNSSVKKLGLVAQKVKVHSGGLMALAAHGAAQLDAEKVMQTGSIPTIVKMLRSGTKAAAGANMWKADVDIAIVEKAIVNLNGMVFNSQIRLDAKNDECEEWKAKYTETLDQINGDLARLGEELSNTARAILNHMGGIDANVLNNQQTKEELQKELLAYNEVRNADLIVLKERETNMAVSAFILVFSACPDAPAASSSAAMLQGANRLRIQSVQTCVNATNGTQKLTFKDPKLDEAAQRLTEEAQDTLFRFIETEESKKGGKKIAAAANNLEAEALGTFEVVAEDLDDGDKDTDADDASLQYMDDSDDFYRAQAEEQEEAGYHGFGGAMLQKKQDPCGPQLERQPVPEEGACGALPASCCGCNKFFTTAEGNGNDEMGWCSFVPAERKCMSGAFLSKEGKDLKSERVCGLKKPEQAVKKPPKSEMKAANRCSNAKFDCGVLHDMFAALWGETKDLVDELTYKMNQDSAAWDRVKGDINSLLQTQATQLAALQAALAEASAMKAEQTDEQAAKQKEKVDTTKLFDDAMSECREVMKEILFTEICGVLAVRNNMVAAHFPGEPTPTDCGVGEWVAGDCSVPCDDELQGGVHSLVREVITAPTTRGVACPSLTTQRKCKQIPCPIECGLSPWSAWGKCTKECGGGIQSGTRSLEVKPKNGGSACDVLTQSQPCNSGACDVDCVLGEWMPFKTCTKACNGGYEERRKRVISEKKGDGFCLPWNHKDRLERKPCNTQACTGDEECNTTMDLVIAIDSSGSITEAGFDILKEFAAKIVRRMMATVQVGVVLFGNGKLDLETNVISDAKVVTDNLEGDMEAVAGKVEGMIIHKGFTNMAQAFTKSKDVLTYARKGSKTVMLMLTDGRPSFKFQTGFAMRSLRKSTRIMIIQVQANRKQEIAELLKGYVSEPFIANYRHIPGKKKLRGAFDSYVTSAIADMCPKLVSPSALAECTVTDGASESEVYPCECGKAICKPGEFCNGEDNYCVPPELALMQHGKKSH
jgi:hypothetical protein